MASEASTHRLNAQDWSLANFAKSSVKKFPAGTFRVDLAQPGANTAFYCLEPQAADGFVGRGVLTNYLQSLGIDKPGVVYPIYKYFKILD